MSRIRSIKPEWLDDELLTVASSDARVLSIALICLADDFGNGRAGRLQLSGKIFPGKPLEIIEEALAELERIRYVRLYEVDGQRYFSIRNWDKHQRVDRPGLPKVPRPNLVSDEIDRELLGASNSQESPAASQESPGLFPTSCVPSPIPQSGISSSPPKPDPDPTSRPGSARARGTRQARDLKPFVMHAAWIPDDAFVAAQAEKFAVSAERVRALLPEFRYYWGKRGDRKTEQNWERTLANRVAMEARSGALYAEAGPARAMGAASGAAAALARVRALEAEEAAGGRP